jgi:hypothetical protein
MRITAVTTRAFRIPLKERLVSATLSLTHRELLVVEVATDAGASGTGWCTTPGIGALAARTLIDQYLAPLLIGQDPRGTEGLWQRMWKHCHYAGPGGITTLAIAPIDTALWDLRPGWPVSRCGGCSAARGRACRPMPAPSTPISRRTRCWRRWKGISARAMAPSS